MAKQSIKILRRRKWHKWHK